jgi:hypothetical protein
LTKYNIETNDGYGFFKTNDPVEIVSAGSYTLQKSVIIDYLGEYEALCETAFRPRISTLGGGAD